MAASSCRVSHGIFCGVTQYELARSPSCCRAYSPGMNGDSPAVATPSNHACTTNSSAGPDGTCCGNSEFVPDANRHTHH